MTGVLIRRGKCHVKTHRDTQGEGHVLAEAEITVMCLQPKKHRGLPGTTGSWEIERHGMDSHIDPLRERDTLISDFQPLEL